MTHIELEVALGHAIRGDQGAAQRIIDHDKMQRQQIELFRQQTDTSMDALSKQSVEITQLRQQVADLERLLAQTQQELAQRKLWQRCETHGRISAMYEWGCPDCVHEVRAQLASMSQERDLLNRDNHALREAKAEKVPCAWVQDGDGEDSWDTACHHRFMLTAGIPSEHGMQYCCYCGGTLREQVQAEEVSDEDA
jgi:hypothetical protein